MPVYHFREITVDPRTQAQLPPLGEGHCECFDLYFPGDAQAAYQFARQQNVGGSWQVRDYKLYPCTQEHGQPVVLCIQRKPRTAVSQAHVQGGQPIGPPQGRANGNRQQGQRDGLGFVEESDGALGGPSGDGMYSDGGDMQGTYTDLIDGGRSEVHRPNQQRR